MSVSYLVTCHNEESSLDKLLSILVENKDDAHEIVLIDDFSDNKNTLDIIDKYRDSIIWKSRNLDRNYGAQKNFGIENCSCDWIFQIDADEYPTIELIKNINAILDANINNEVLWIPRLNIFHGVDDNDIRQWGWAVTKFPQIVNEKSIKNDSSEYVFLKNNSFIISESKESSGYVKIKYNIPLINVPDYQSRLFKNLDHIRYKRRLHEKVEGFKSYAFIPPQPDIALIHEKSIEKQRATNIRYNTDFTVDENRGYSIEDELKK